MLKHLLSNPKFGICVIAVSLFSGCASLYREKITVQDMIDFEVDCKIKDQQIVYLESIKPKRSEKHAAEFEMKASGIFTKDLLYKRNLSQGELDYWIDQNLTELSKCKKRM